MQTIEFDIKGFAKGNKPDDSKTTETQQRRSEVFFHGQKAVGCLKDAYELLSGTLSLQVWINALICCLLSKVNFSINIWLSWVLLHGQSGVS